jgi:hypothetical protein
MRPIKMGFSIIRKSLNKQKKRFAQFLCISNLFHSPIAISPIPPHSNNQRLQKIMSLSGTLIRIANVVAAAEMEAVALKKCSPSLKMCNT